MAAMVYLQMVVIDHDQDDYELLGNKIDQGFELVGLESRGVITEILPGSRTWNEQMGDND